MNRRIAVGCLVLALPAVALLAASFYRRYSVEQALAEQVRLAKQEAERIRAQVVLFSERVIPPGLGFSDSLQGMGLDRASVFYIVQRAKPVYDLARVRAGNRLAVGRSVEGELRAVRYQINRDQVLWIAPRGREFHAEIRSVPSTTQVVGVVGEVRDSLFNAVTDAGEGPELALELADIFGWDLDFYTDPQPGDRFRIAVEKKKYQNGQRAYGRILAAEYNNAGHAYRAVLFRDPAGKPAYYAPDGSSLQKAFLRSPLKYSAPITSHFSRRRFHPILKRHRPHLGIDYAAPAGTPVQAIGDGRVVFAGRESGAGKMVHIRHTNGYDTFYLHLSRLLVQAGQRVQQGERIGLVGSTGLATGAHLDFRIRQHGSYRNFEALRLPPARPVAKKDWPQFAAARERCLALLPSSPQEVAPPSRRLQERAGEDAGSTPKRVL